MAEQIKTILIPIVEIKILSILSREFGVLRTSINHDNLSLRVFFSDFTSKGSPDWPCADNHKISRKIFQHILINVVEYLFSATIDQIIILQDNSFINQLLKKKKTTEGKIRRGRSDLAIPRDREPRKLHSNPRLATAS